MDINDALTAKLRWLVVAHPEKLVVPVPTLKVSITVLNC